MKFSKMEAAQQIINAVSVLSAKQEKQQNEIFEDLRSHKINRDVADNRLRVLDKNTILLKKHLKVASQKLKDFERIQTYRNNLINMKINVFSYWFFALYFTLVLSLERFLYGNSYDGQTWSYCRIVYTVLNIQITSIALTGLQKWQRTKLLWVIVSQIIWIILRAFIALVKLYYDQYWTALNYLFWIFHLIADLRLWIKQFRDMKKPRPNIRGIELVAAWMANSRSKTSTMWLYENWTDMWVLLQNIQ